MEHEEEDEWWKFNFTTSEPSFEMPLWIAKLKDVASPVIWYVTHVQVIAFFLQTVKNAYYCSPI